ncbi:type II toxin-antitoxin system YoeB family toxin [candidate division KSB1 bacterium]|nr:type II toxin-antitoxin system YoeB family toxin [candidate division KSB1 bacterium]
MQIATTRTFDRLFNSLDKKIQRKAAKKTEIFKQNPFNPILRTEKLHLKTHEVWSFRIDLDYRIVFKFVEKNLAEFRFIGHHNKIYDYPIFLD